MSSNYFEEAEWQETKKAVDEKISKKKTIKQNSLKTFDEENPLPFIQAIKFFTGRTIKVEKYNKMKNPLFKQE